MAGSKRKAIRNLAQEKVVDISNYRDLKQGREAQVVALVSQSSELFDELKEALPEAIEVLNFDSRFSFEQALKSKEWDSLILDEREMGDDALQLCEKLKRQSKMEELVVIILSSDSEKERVRKALEMGCDEWVTQIDPTALKRLLSHHLQFR